MRRGLIDLLIPRAKERVVLSRFFRAKSTEHERSDIIRNAIDLSLCPPTNRLSGPHASPDRRPPASIWLDGCSSGSTPELKTTERKTFAERKNLGFRASQPRDIDRRNVVFPLLRHVLLFLLLLRLAPQFRVSARVTSCQFIGYRSCDKRRERRKERFARVPYDFM